MLTLVSNCLKGKPRERKKSTRGVQTSRFVKRSPIGRAVHLKVTAQVQRENLETDHEQQNQTYGPKIHSKATQERRKEVQ